jgi:hypothetical protein
MEPASMSRKSNSAKSLLDDLVGATKAATGYHETHVRHFVEPAFEYLLREYGGERLPKIKSRSYPTDDILAALDRGLSKKEVCRRFRIARCTLYRIIANAH